MDGIFERSADLFVGYRMGSKASPRTWKPGEGGTISLSGFGLAGGGAGRTICLSIDSAASANATDCVSPYLRDLREVFTRMASRRGLVEQTRE